MDVFDFKILKQDLKFAKKISEILLYNYESTYEQLLKKAGGSSQSINRLRTLCVEIYKILNELNPSVIKNIFTVKETDRLTREQYKLNLDTPPYNQMTFGYNSLGIFGPKIQIKLPYHIKSSENLICLKELIENWDGTRCSYKISSFILINIYCLESVLIDYIS